MKTRYLAILATLTFLGYSAPAFAPPHGACSPWPSCKDDVEPVEDVDNSGLFTVTVSFETSTGVFTSAGSKVNVVGEDDDRRPGLGPTSMTLNLDLMSPLPAGCGVSGNTPGSQFNISTAKLRHAEFFTFVTANWNFVGPDGMNHFVTFAPEGDGEVDDDNNWLPASGQTNTLTGHELELGSPRGPNKEHDCNGTIMQNWQIVVLRTS